jgi:hypothetical protein
MVQRNQFGWAHESKIKRVEKYPGVLAIAGFVEIQVTDNFAVAQNGRRGEIGGLSANQYAHRIFPLLAVSILLIVMRKHAAR